MKPPVIGITVDNRDNTATSGRYESSIAYSRCVAQAGGLPVLLPHEPQWVAQFVGMCDGFVLTGGVDPRTEAFGQPTHPRARPMDEQRQAFELALLAAMEEYPNKPVLGICLGMQLMALRAGGTLHQYLPDILDNPQLHENDNRHAITLRVPVSALTDQLLTEAQAVVVSWHRQAVAPGPDDDGGVGRMRVLATAQDGVIEAIDDPGRPFYLGVQWHPERGGQGELNQGLFDRFVAACH